MARGSRADDELTDDTEVVGRVESLAEKSDRLAAEYARDRQIRLREDRVRRIDPPEASAKGAKAGAKQGPPPPSRPPKERPPLPA
jgi:hypothetical protein